MKLSVQLHKNHWRIALTLLRFCLLYDGMECTLMVERIYKVGSTEGSLPASAATMSRFPNMLLLQAVIHRAQL